MHLIAKFSHNIENYFIEIIPRITSSVLMSSVRVLSTLRNTYKKELKEPSWNCRGTIGRAQWGAAGAAMGVLLSLRKWTTRHMCKAVLGPYCGFWQRGSAFQNRGLGSGCARNCLSVYLGVGNISGHEAPQASDKPPRCRFANALRGWVFGMAFPSFW